MVAQVKVSLQPTRLESIITAIECGSPCVLDRFRFVMNDYYIKIWRWPSAPSTTPVLMTIGGDLPLVKTGHIFFLFCPIYIWIVSSKERTGKHKKKLFKNTNQNTRLLHTGVGEWDSFSLLPAGLSSSEAKKRGRRRGPLQVGGTPPPPRLGYSAATHQTLVCAFAYPPLEKERDLGRRKKKVS